MEAEQKPLFKELKADISRDELSAWFSQDSVRTGQSLHKLESVLGLSGLCTLLGTSMRFGVSNDPIELAHRRQLFGSNVYAPKRYKSVFSMIVDALSDNVLQILILAAVISLVIGLWQDPNEGWMEGAAILLAVVIVVSVTTTNEYFKQKQFIKLNATADKTNVMVVRGGRDMEVPVEDVVVGEVVYVKSGDVVQVDGVLFRSNGVIADESSITGESELIRKDAPTGESTNPSPFILSGSKISEGNGQMVVCAVGAKSLLGKSREMLEEEDEDPTPLQQKLEVIAEDIGKLGMAAGLLTFMALMVYLGIDTASRGTWDASSWKALIDSFIIMITIVVVAVPEGLPLAVTLSLAYAVGKMKEENNFVRHLHACETMGGANNICSDKTGTLTENKMTVTHLYAGGKRFEGPDGSAVAAPLKGALVENMCCNSTAFFEKDDKGKQVASGSMTECAMLGLCSGWGIDYTTIRSSDKEVVQFPFSSSTKRMTTVLNSEEGVKVLTKGAAEIVLALCTEVMLPDGHITPMTLDMQSDIQAAIKEYAHNALRAITLACKVLTPTQAALVRREDGLPQEELEAGLVFLGMVGIQDPVRKEVPEAVAVAHKAGVTVRMVTGDNVETAIAIAKQCGIIPPDYIPDRQDYVILQGFEFRELVGGLVTKEEDASDSDSDSGKSGKSKKSKKSSKKGSEKAGEVKPEEKQKKKTVHTVGNLEMFSEIATRLRVLARSSPEDKFLLVTGLKQLGNVVAVTGDGSNDAPALKKSDVGLAMNITGTGLAKEAADIILIDDNFASIITAIKWGRNIYDCVRKFLQFQLTVNVVALFMVFLGAVVVEESPLTAIQMLWVNLIMDTLAALALATGKPDLAVLNKTPYPRNEYIVTGDMALLIAGTGIFQIAWLMVILFMGPELFGIPTGWGNSVWDFDNGKHFTIFFNVFVYLQVFNEINATKLLTSQWNVFKGVLDNGMFVGIMIATVVVQYVLVQFGGQPLQCAPLTFQEHLLCIAIGASIIPGAFVLKVIPAVINLTKKEKTFRKAGLFIK